jgi:hypothetical protein
MPSPISIHNAPSDDDLFTMQVQPRQPRRRRSSHFNRWIHDQQNLPAGDPAEIFDITGNAPALSNGSQCHPYLAYPHLSRLSLNPTTDDRGSLNSYDIVDDDDIPEVPEEFESQGQPSTPNRTTRSSDLPQTPSTLRKFHLAFRPGQAVGHPSPTSTPSRMGFFQRHPSPSPSGPTTPSRRHNRSSSLSTLNLPRFGSTNNHSGTASSSWKWRPSVLGHFSTPSAPQASTSANADCQIILSRPSLSSSSTYTPTATMTTEDESLLTPPKVSSIASTSSRSYFSSSRSLVGPGIGSDSSPSLWTPSLSHLDAGPAGSEFGSTPVLGHKASTIRMPFSSKPAAKSRLFTPSNASSSDCDEEGVLTPQPVTYDPSRPYVAYSLHKQRGALPRVSLSSLTSPSRSKTRRTLVVSGVGVNDSRRFEGVKRWCEVGNFLLPVGFANASYRALGK